MINFQISRNALQFAAGVFFGDNIVKMFIVASKKKKERKGRYWPSFFSANLSYKTSLRTKFSKVFVLLLQRKCDDMP